jgi:hypothetical protein
LSGTSSSTLPGQVVHSGFQELSQSPAGRVPAAEVETKSSGCVSVWGCGGVGVCIYKKSLFLELGGSFFTYFGVAGAPGERPEHHVEEVAKTNRISTKKSLPQLIVAPFWLRQGTLWYLWGSFLSSFLLHWGVLKSSGAKAPKRSNKNTKHGSQNGTLLGSFVG